MAHIDTFVTISSFASDRRALACVNRAWNAAATDGDRAWAGSLMGDYQLRNVKQAPVRDYSLGIPVIVSFPTYRETWQAWRVYEKSEEDRGEGRLRFADIWLRGLSALQSIRSEFERTQTLKQLRLQPGHGSPVDHCRSSAPEFVRKNDRFVEIIRVIWGSYDGQHNSYAGFFGFTWYYDQFRYATLNSLSETTSTDSDTFYVASGFGVAGPNEFIFMTCDQHLQFGHPNSVKFQSEAKQDALLDFFEYYAHDLVANRRTTISLEGQRFLSAFPHTGPRTSLAITHNIRVHGSYTCDPRNGPGGDLLWVYQFRIDLIPPIHPEYIPKERRIWTTAKVKLLRRHWVIVDPTKSQPIIVDGDGVVGLQPVLDEGTMSFRNKRNFAEQLPFAYRSCTHASNGTYMEGYLTFAPVDGNVVLEDCAFPVRVNRLTFTYPRYAI